MIGVARCSSSMPPPTPVRMSGSARTTTYVSAAVTRTASVARATSGSPGRSAAASAGGRCGDVDIGDEVTQLDRVGGVVLGAEEGAGELGPAQLAAVGGDGEAGADRCARVLTGEHPLHQVAGQLRGHLLHDSAVDPLLVAELGVLGLGQQLGDAGVGVEQGAGVAEPVLGGVAHAVAAEERQLNVNDAADGY